MFKNSYIGQTVVADVRKILYTVPLNRHCKFKITFKSIYEMNRTLDIRVCDRSDKNPGRPTAALFEYDYYTFYLGYYNKFNLTGKTPGESWSDPKGFDVGKNYFVEFWPGDKVRYYNDEGTLDLTGSFEGKEGPFHLLIWLYYFKTSFTVERLF